MSKISVKVRGPLDDLHTTIEISEESYNFYERVSGSISVGWDLATDCASLVMVNRDTGEVLHDLVCPPYFWRTYVEELIMLYEANYYTK